MILKAADNQIKIVVIDVKEIGTEFIFALVRSRTINGSRSEKFCINTDVFKLHVQ